MKYLKEYYGSDIKKDIISDILSDADLNYEIYDWESETLNPSSGDIHNDLNNGEYEIRIKCIGEYDINFIKLFATPHGRRSNRLSIEGNNPIIKRICQLTGLEYSNSYYYGGNRDLFLIFVEPTIISEMKHLKSNSEIIIEDILDDALEDVENYKISEFTRDRNTEYLLMHIHYTNISISMKEVIDILSLYRKECSKLVHNDPLKPLQDKYIKIFRQVGFIERINQLTKYKLIFFSDGPPSDLLYASDSLILEFRKLD